MKRQFITKTEIDRLLDLGSTVLQVDDQTTVTDLAREYAQQRGISVVTVGRPAKPGALAGSVADAPGATQLVDPDADCLRAAVRSAVLAAMGEAPPGLDAAIARVLRDQQGARS